jgi:hypothetical protein
LNIPNPLELVLMCIFGLGGDYDGDRSMDDLKLLYRAYLTDSLSDGRMEENKVNRWQKSLKKKYF